MATTRTARLATLFAVTTVTALAGCEAAPRGPTPESLAPEAPAIRPPADALAETPTPPATRQESAKPDLQRLEYDANRRVLRVYPLAERTASWMLVLPGAPMGVPFEGEYEFPAAPGWDLDQVHLFTTMPNRRPSPSVTLREILDAGGASVRR